MPSVQQLVVLVVLPARQLVLEAIPAQQAVVALHPAVVPQVLLLLNQAAVPSQWVVQTTPVDPRQIAPAHQQDPIMGRRLS